MAVQSLTLREARLTLGITKMNRERISARVTELEQLVPTENASVLFSQYGGGPDESKNCCYRSRVSSSWSGVLEGSLRAVTERRNNRNRGES